MPTLDATVGGPAANSFATVAECDTYCDNQLNALEWENADDDTKARALMRATLVLNDLWSGQVGFALPWESFVGFPATSTQRLAWPRLYASNPDAPSVQTLGDLALLYFAENVIPQRVKDATCELALQFVKAGTSDVAMPDPSIAVIRERVDVIETEYAKPQERAQGLSRFPIVLARLGPLIDPSRFTMAVVRT